MSIFACAHPELPFSRALRHGDLVFVAGQVADGPDAPGPGGSFDAEVRRTVDNLRDAAESVANGGGLQFLQVRAYLADLEDFAAFNAAWDAVAPTPRPVRTTVGTALLHGWRIELDATAIVL